MIQTRMRASLRQLLIRMCTVNTLSAQVCRRVLRESRYFSFRTLIDCGAFSRPAYAYGIYHAAALAKLQHLSRISIIELGVAGGNGLLAMEQYARRTEQELGVTIEIYGFDTGSGLPDIQSLYDLPYWFRPSMYAMDQNALRSRLTTAQLVIGNVKETAKVFFDNYRPAPIGFIANDLDLYSSTCDSLSLLDADEQYFLPRFIIYLDDMIGTYREQYCDGIGVLRAIHEFNTSHDAIGIWPNTNLRSLSHLQWPMQVFYVHRFKHPHYSKFVGACYQKTVETALRLTFN